MRRVAYFCAFFLASTFTSYSQWELRYPHQYDYPVSDFVFVSARDGYFTTTNGVIQKTTDSSKSWQTSAYIAADQFLSISFADSIHGIAYSPYSYLDDTTYLLSTRDGGASWIQSGVLQGGSMMIGNPQKAHVFFVNDSTALATFEDGNIRRSVNNLLSWRLVRENRYYMPSDYGIPFGWIASFSSLSNGVILAVGSDVNAYRDGVINDSISYILKSTDDGKSWETLWRGSTESMLMVSFADTLVGWMCSDSAIYKTTNGGASWKEQKRAISSAYPLLGIAACDSNTVYAIDRSGDFYSSSNGGNNWTTHYGFQTYPTAKIQFLSKELGYGGGASGLYRTTDAGLTWTKQTGEYAGRLDKLVFADDETGYALVSNTLSKTTDGGYSWRALPEHQYNVHGLALPDSLDLWIASQDTVLHSTDGGITWTSVHFDSGFVQKVYFLDRDFGVLYDVWKTPTSYSSEVVVVTTNGGSTWSRYQLPQSLRGINKLSFISTDEGWLDSQQGLYHSTDGGQSWVAILRGVYGNPWNQGAFSFDFVDSNIGWLAYYNLIYSTTDGGRNWVQKYLPYAVEIKDMKFANTKVGFAVGANGRIFSTTDAGDTWITESTPGPSDLFSVSMVSVGNTAQIRIGGDGLTILARDIVTGVDADNGHLPADYFLSQNYPNPFNPSTTIRYGLPQKSAVQVSVFNTLGQQVATLVQGEKQAGYHEVRFDASGLSSGVYFYRLQAGDYVATKKLLLLK